jgi:SPP1 family predicted phage head-tail adaptor
VIARQYNRKIQIWKTTSVTDGYGGNTVTDVLIGSFWSEVKQNSAFRDNSIGKSDIKNNWSFNIRANPVLLSDIDNLFIIYNGSRYIVNDFRYNDELRREINIIANGG